MITPFSSFYRIGSNYRAEGLTILKRIQSCFHNQGNNVIIESDSMLLVNMIKGTMVDHIKDIMKKGDVKVSPCFRVANNVADALANFAANDSGEALFNEAISLPRNVSLIEE